MLQTHKWRRPKWVKFPRTMLEDARWIRLSDKARAAWIDILLIASESPNSELPEPDRLYLRLNALGLTRNRKIFTALIDELNQCGFLTKTSPELQSYRVSEIQSPLLRNGDFVAIEDSEVRQTQEKRVAEEVAGSSPLGQPKLAEEWSTPWIEEITGRAETNGQGLSYAAALGSFRPVKSRFDRH
jgi:hypothetical protein